MHLLVAAAALARPARSIRDRWTNAVVLFGALLPDLSIYVLFAWARLFAGYSERAVWNELYWQEPWQTAGAVLNSFPLFALLVLAAMVLKQRWLLYLSIAALLHLALDFPVHREDAHRHFWPFSDWRWISPVSYYDSRYYGDVVTWIERAIGLALIILLWRRFQGRVVRATLAVTFATFFLVPVYFSLMLN